MLFLSCLLLAFAGLANGQSHGHGHLHGGICHSNHQQMTEHQVIERVSNEVDVNNDDSITLGEMVVFFADLLGHLDGFGVSPDAILAMGDELLLQMAAGFHITSSELTHAWHARYHDSPEFIKATFDTVLDTNHDGVVDAAEIKAVQDLAQNNFDANSDGILQKSEFVTFLENLYLSDNCA